MPDFDISGILANGLAQRQQYLNQPKGWGTALPVLGNAVNDIVQKKMQLQAQQDYANFLSLPPDQRQDPQNAMRGYKAALALGINPPIAKQAPDQMITDPQVLNRLGYSAPVNMAQARVAGKPNRPTFSELSSDEQSAINKALDESRLDPSQITSRNAKMLARQFMNNPSYNARQSTMGYKAATAGAEASSRLTQGGSSQVVARTAQSALEQLDLLQKASDKFPRSDTQFMNTPIIALARQRNPQAQQWLIQAQTARAEYATALNRGNSPSKEQIDEATKALPDTITPAQLPAAIQQLRAGLEATVKGQMTPAGSAQPKTDTSSQSQKIGRFQVEVQ